MSNGLIGQPGTPFEIYNFPTTVFVASFVGSLNLIEVVVTDASQGEFTIGGQKVHAAKPLEFQNNDKIKISVRPKIISLRSGGPEYKQLSAVVDTFIFLSSLVRIQVKFGANHLVFDIFNHPNLVPPKLADNVTLFF